MEQIKEVKKYKRNWKSQRHPRVFTVRATEKEYRELVRQKEIHGTSLSRLLVDSALCYEGPPVFLVDSQKQAVEELLFEVRKIGINLNQIAKVMNASRYDSSKAPSEEKVVSTVAEVESVIRKLSRIF